MSREIKFKAWHAGSKEMMPWERIKSEGESYDCSVFAMVFLDSDYLLLQFTGLKDKNGVEIFEGDIFPDSWGNENVFVSMIAGSYSMTYKDGRIWGHLRMFLAGNNGKEILGNIHQHPELVP